MNLIVAVTHDLENKRAWAPCLKVEGVKLPTGYFIGASAATGNKSSSLKANEAYLWCHFFSGHFVTKRGYVMQKYMFFNHFLVDIIVFF